MENLYDRQINKLEELLTNNEQFETMYEKLTNNISNQCLAYSSDYIINKIDELLDSVVFVAYCRLITQCYDDQLNGKMNVRNKEIELIKLICKVVEYPEDLADIITTIDDIIVIMYSRMYDLIFQYIDWKKV